MLRLAQIYQTVSQASTPEAGLGAVSAAVTRGWSPSWAGEAGEEKQEDLDKTLNWAVENNLIALAKLLLDLGANVHYFSEYPLRFAASAGKIEMVKLLLQRGADVHAVHDQAIRLAAQQCHRDIVVLLLQHGAEFSKVNPDTLAKLNLSNQDLKSAAKSAFSEMRDDAKSPPLTKAGLRYARMKGMDGHDHEQKYLSMVSSLVGTRVKAPFRPKNVGKVMGKQASGAGHAVFGKEQHESTDQELLNRELQDFIYNGMFGGEQTTAEKVAKLERLIAAGAVPDERLLDYLAIPGLQRKRDQALARVLLKAGVSPAGLSQEKFTHLGLDNDNLKDAAKKAFQVEAQQLVAGLLGECLLGE